MNFVKKLFRFLMFGCGLGGIFVLFSLSVEGFGLLETSPDWLFLLAFALGLLLGYFCFSSFEKAKGMKRKILSCFGAVAFTFFGTIIGFVVGADLGGNGLWVIEWGGLQGYESTGLLVGILAATLAAIVSTLVLSDKKNVLETICFGSLGALLALLLTGEGIQVFGPFDLFLPLLFIWLWDLYQAQRSRRHSGR